MTGLATTDRRVSAATPFARAPRLLHVTGGRVYGGIEANLRALATALPGDDRQAFALAFDGRLGDELRAAGAPLFVLGDDDLRVKNPASIRRARARLRAAVDEWRPDAVLFHAPWSFAVLGSRGATRGLPRVLCAHGPWMRHWADVATKLRRPDAVVANSRWTLVDIAAHYPATVQEVVHPAVPAPPISAVSPEAVAYRSRMRTEMATGNEPVVVLSARFDPWKGHAVLVDALARIADRPWTAWFVGGVQREVDRVQMDTVRARAAAAGIGARLRFPGQRSDAATLLLAADVYCQPSLTPEPFGISIVEALWARLPVVATRAGGPAEIVDDGCGVLVGPGDVTGLAGALASLLDAPARRRELGAAGPARAAALCAPAAQRARLLAFASRVLAQRRATA